MSLVIQLPVNNNSIPEFKESEFLRTDLKVLSELSNQFEKLSSKQHHKFKIRIANKIYVEVLAQTLAFEEVFFRSLKQSSRCCDLLYQLSRNDDYVINSVMKLWYLDEDINLHHALNSLCTHVMQCGIVEKLNFIHLLIEEGVEIQGFADQYRFSKKRMLKQLNNGQDQVDSKMISRLVGLTTEPIVDLTLEQAA